MADLVDSQGIPLADHHRWLPDRVALWPTPRKLVDKEAAIEWKRSHAGIHFRCWWCGRVPHNLEEWSQIEVHHLSGGAQRHDAKWNFFLACSNCHRHDGDVAMRKNLYRVLTLKHKYDQQSTSWTHLAIGLGRRLPTAEGE